MKICNKHSEEEKVGFFLQKLQKYMLVAHTYQVEKLIREIKQCWSDLDELGNILELVQ